MRILTAGNGYPPHHHGGYELVWHSAVEHLRAQGHDVEVLTTDFVIDESDPDPVTVHRDFRWHLRDGRFEHLGLAARVALARHNHRVLAAHIDRMRPDVIGWWSMGGLSLTMMETVRRREIPAVAFVHDEWLDYGQWADAWLATFLGPRRARLAPLAERVFGIPTTVDFGNAATYVFVSEFTRRQASSLGLGLTSTAIAHSGIHVDFLNPAPARDWAWRLLYVGRIDHRKGIDTAISSIPHLPSAATLTIAGSWDPAEELRLRRLATELGIAERVNFVGKLDRKGLIGAYGDADAVIFPVRWNEPWGLVPLEAMAHGRPVVATGRGGSAEYLRDGINCLLFKADDERGLARKLRLLSGDSELRRKLREAGFGTASKHTERNFNREVEAALIGATSGVDRISLPRAEGTP